MESRLSGIFTIRDQKLYEYMRKLEEKEHIFLEPSACAAFEGAIKIQEYEEGQQYLATHDLNDKLKDSVQIAWATGGQLVPEEIRKQYRQTYL